MMPPMPVYARYLLSQLAVPTAVAVIAGIHWLGVVLAVALFAVWCSYEPRPADA